jgi:hypothetical protein
LLARLADIPRRENEPDIQEMNQCIAHGSEKERKKKSEIPVNERQ